MLLGLAVILGTIGLGTLLAFLPGMGGRALGAVLAFALSAAAAVVMMHLLPESLAALGPPALIGLAIGLLVPAGIERLFGGHRVAFEVGFIGLLAHSVGDGVALWTFTRPDHVHLGAAFALAAHMVPVTTVLVLRDTQKKGAALVRAALIAAFTILGLAAGDWLTSGVLPSIQPWISAIASGLLLHVVAHDVGAIKAVSQSHRPTLVAAGLAGLAMPLLGMVLDGHGGEGARALLDGVLGALGGR